VLPVDRLSAASRNHNGSYANYITPRYKALYSHYGLTPSSSNCGFAYEIGVFEGTHGQLKRRLEQKLQLRGSTNFEDLAEYGALLAEVIS
jgi:hypothetical protein